MHNQQSPTFWLSISVCIALLLIPLYHFYIFKNNLPFIPSYPATDWTALPSCETQLLTVLPKGTVCLHTNERPLKTTSDVERWNFTEKRFVLAQRAPDDQKWVVLVSEQSQQFPERFPVIIRCTWGCYLLH